MTSPAPSLLRPEVAAATDPEVRTDTDRALDCPEEDRERRPETDRWEEDEREDRPEEAAEEEAEGREEGAAARRPALAVLVAAE
ncbi:hypothetical protein [Streptomyces sp. TP-A0874]|uniref:hypothetical protein n=1 Tax=Streptomyces sp. TP-A0874 TaxID=549819 RepID=UPI003F92FADF